MNIRAWAGTAIWTFGFNLFVAFIVYNGSISWGISILCIRHVFWGIPKIFKIWRKVIVGNADTPFQSKPPDIKWPNRMWIFETLICVLLSLGSLLWLNIPLKNFLTQS